MGKFRKEERTLVKSIVATLSIKKFSEDDIIRAIYEQTKKTITKRALYDLKQSIKRDSYQWYKTMREGQYEYVHEFKERINEIYWLQKYHHDIIDNHKDNTAVQQTSLAELHRLNITLSNYFDVAPDIIGNGSTISETPKAKASTAATSSEIIV